MKKHYIIVGILLVSALFFIPAIVKKYNESKIGNKQKEDASTLNERIEKFGQNSWSPEMYDALINEINGLASDQQISASERDSYRSNLNINMQNALVISYEKSLRESCYNDKVKQLQKASDTIVNIIPELVKQRKIYQSYIIALGYRNKLNYLLSRQYSESNASALISNFSSALSAQPFANCSEIQSLRRDIKQECAYFEEFDNNFNQIVNIKEDYYYYDINSNPILKYGWYRKILIEKQK
jgi:hypothetical protein